MPNRLYTLCTRLFWSQNISNHRTNDSWIVSRTINWPISIETYWTCLVPIHLPVMNHFFQVMILVTQLAVFKNRFLFGYFNLGTILIWTFGLINFVLYSRLCTVCLISIRWYNSMVHNIYVDDFVQILCVCVCRLLPIGLLDWLIKPER